MHSSTIFQTGLIAALGSFVEAFPVGSAPAPSGAELAHLPRQVQGVEPIKVAPVKNPNKKGNGFAKVIDVELKNEEHIFFHSDGVFAEATVIVSGDKQKIISADRMDDELRSLACPSATELIVELGTQAGYDKAKASWTWVTGSDHSFVFIADGDCGGDDGLQPYVINDASFDDGSLKATLKGQVQHWDEWVTDGRLHASTEPFDGFRDLPEKRKSGDVSFAKDFSGKEIFGRDVGPNNNTRIGLTCADCGLTGGVHYDLDIGFSDGITGSITATNGLGARFGLGLRLAGQLTAPKDWSVDILPPTGIPGASFDFKLASVGFEAAVAAQASLTSVEGELEALFGVAMTIPDQTTFRFGGDSDSINPQFTQIGPEFSASISVSAQMSPVVTLGIGARILGKGFAAGVAVQAPRLTATLGAEVTTQGTCNNPNAIASIGLRVELDAGISVFGGLGKPTDLPNAKEVYTSPSYSIFDKCFPIGGDNPPPPQAPANTCPDGRQMVGDVRYEDNSYARYCNRGSGDVSLIFPGPNDSNIWEIGLDENGPVSSCTFHKKSFSNDDYSKWWCEEPIVELQKGFFYTLPEDTRPRNLCVVCN